jgi:sulfite exporter TauE/SafE
MEYSEQFSFIFSLFSLGFFGGFSHCVGMCGPFVLTQVGNRLQKIPLENFSQLTRLKNSALLPYHFGRITTYSMIGFCCSFLGKKISDSTNFKIFSATILTISALFFLQLFFEKNFFKLPFKSKTLKNLTLFNDVFSKKISAKISFLFQDPQGFKGYFLGLVLGFIPCGLLYGAFMICVTIPNPLFAFFGMFLFGISTFPALFFTGLGGSFFLKDRHFKILTKTIIFLNAIMLLMMAFKTLTT